MAFLAHIVDQSDRFITAMGVLLTRHAPMGRHRFRAGDAVGQYEMASPTLPL